MKNVQKSLDISPKVSTHFLGNLKHAMYTVNGHHVEILIRDRSQYIVAILVPPFCLWLYPISFISSSMESLRKRFLVVQTP